MDTPAETNGGFEEKVGVDFTTASRYRNGDRVPSTRTAQKIADAYGLDVAEMLRAIAGGREEFGYYIRTRVFGPEDIDQDRWQAELAARDERASKKGSRAAA